MWPELRKPTQENKDQLFFGKKLILATHTTQSPLLATPSSTLQKCRRLRLS